MQNDAKINLLARVARSSSRPGAPADPSKPLSILSLAATSYGARPDDDATVPTGFDPAAVALFESIVEGAYLVSTADGVFDEDERAIFERLVVTACGGTVPPKQIAALVDDLADQLREDGLDRRIEALAKLVTKKEHAREVLRIAALLAIASADVGNEELVVLDKLARAFDLGEGAVGEALADVREAMGESAKPSF